MAQRPVESRLTHLSASGGHCWRRKHYLSFTLRRSLYTALRFRHDCIKSLEADVTLLEIVDLLYNAVNSRWDFTFREVLQERVLQLHPLRLNPPRRPWLSSPEIFEISRSYWAKAPTPDFLRLHQRALPSRSAAHQLQAHTRLHQVSQEQ